jgi:hypothetical protein
MADDDRESYQPQEFRPLPQPANKRGNLRVPGVHRILSNDQFYGTYTAAPVERRSIAAEPITPAYRGGDSG